MTKQEVDDLAERGRRVYAEKLSKSLEPIHKGEFVAIDPDSGEYFLGASMEEVCDAAHRAHPDQLVYVTRVGFPSAVEFGYAYPEGEGR